MRRLRDVIDRGEAGFGAFVRSASPASNSTSQTLAKLAARVEEIQQAAAHAAHRRDFQFAGPDLLAERRVVQLLGAIERRLGAGDLEPDGANRRPMRDVVRMGEAFLLLVDDQIDRALASSASPPSICAVAAALEAETGDETGEFVGGMVVGGKFDEFDAEALRARRHRRNFELGGAGLPRNWSIR